MLECLYCMCILIRQYMREGQTKFPEGFLIQFPMAILVTIFSLCCQLYSITQNSIIIHSINASMHLLFGSISVVTFPRTGSQ